MSITVIIPTIGTGYLYECVQSVLDQTYRDIICMVAIDGGQYRDKVHSILADIHDDRLYILNLPFNTGSGNRNGHHKYGGIPYLVDTPYVSFLDEDNTLLPGHIEAGMDILLGDPSVGMAYSLRTIMDEGGNRVCDDTFESVGNTTSFCDTSTMMMHTRIACRYSYLWVVQEDDPRTSDRLVSGTLLSQVSCKGTGKHTLMYRVYDGKPNGPSFFLKHSASTIANGQEEGGLPTLYVCHFNPKATTDAIAKMDDPDTWREQWQLPIVRALGKYYHIRNAWVDIPPPRSKVLFTCCFPEHLPWAIYTRDDITKYLIAMESPNHMHRRNFDPGFLRHFDRVITYNTQLQGPLGDKYRHTLHPINLEPTDGGHINSGQDKSVCCVLADRRADSTYDILGVQVKALEYLRYEYASHMPGIHCYGRGWVTTGDIIAHGYSPEHPADIHSRYTFSLITENNDAQGGVTEKIYMALYGGSIPLYYHKYGQIPNIPDSCWINIYNILPEDLPSLLDTIDVQAYRDAIYKHREDIFLSVSPTTYAKQLHTIISE